MLADGFDLVHSHDWLVAGAARELARLRGLPWFVTVHATEFGRHQGWVSRHPQSHIHRAERLMVRDANRVIACSDYMRDHIATAFGLRGVQVEVIPNGIEPADAPPADELERLRPDVRALRWMTEELRVSLFAQQLGTAHAVSEKRIYAAMDAVEKALEQSRGAGR